MTLVPWDVSGNCVILTRAFWGGGAVNCFRVLLLVSAAILAPNVALANELSQRTVPTSIAQDFNWTGFYAGVSVGDARYDGGAIAGSSNVASIVPPANIVRFPTSSSNIAGFAAGGLIGYNYQVGRIVLGSETDLSYLNVKSQRSGSTSITCCRGFLENLDAEYRSEVNWLGTARARVGFVPAQRLLVYGTGGLAYGGVEITALSSNTFSGSAPPVFGGVRSGRPLPPPSRLWQGSNSEIKLGWTVGAGGEYALTDHIMLRAEYLYVDLGKSNVVANFVGTPATPAQGQIYYAATRNTTLNVARATVSYKF
jgi:outer membrane immunogenic protein